MLGALAQIVGFVKAKVERGNLDSQAFDHEVHHVGTVVKKLVAVDTAFYVNVLENRI